MMRLAPRRTSALCLNYTTRASATGSLFAASKYQPWRAYATEQQQQKGEDDGPKNEPTLPLQDDDDAESNIAVGLERFEQLGLAKYEMGDTVLRGAFGTRENPVEVPAWYESRIVGCTGGPGNEHEILWHEVREDKPLVCLECGQWFKLVDHPLKLKYKEVWDTLSDEEKEVIEGKADPQ